MQTTARQLVSFVNSISGKVHLTFEEGTQAAWLHDLLRPHVHRLIVCNPRGTKRKGNKNDFIDTLKMANELRGGQLKPVYHGDHGTRPLKELVMGHWNLVRNSTRVKNRIKAVFRSRGISVRGGSVYQPENREDLLRKVVQPAAVERTLWLFDELDAIEELREKAEKAIYSEGRKHQACKILQSIPAIGPIRSAQIVSQVATPFRFRTKRQYWSYCGLAVVTHSTSDYEVTEQGIQRKRRPDMTRGLTRDFNRLLKHVYKSAAVDAGIRGKMKEYLRVRIDAGMKQEMALLTLSRKLAAISLALWKRGELFDIEKALKRTDERAHE
jgi:transposase